jgi:protease I
MKKFKIFLRTTVLGGLVVILPVAILVAVFSWLFGVITSLVQPLTRLIIARADIKEFLADVLAIAVIIALCFFIGLFVKTSVGRWMHSFIENKLLRVAPGYNLIKETILQLFGGKKAPFSQVALVQLYENSLLATAFITDEHPDGSFTVFVPTGPNPTSGFVYHLKAKFVHLVNVRVEDAMRSIISCGAGSTKLMKLKGQRILMFVDHVYEDMELQYPRYRLMEEGAEVVVAGPVALERYKGKHGYPCMSDAAINDMNEADFHGLVIPGGFAPDQLRRDPKVLLLTRAFQQSGKLVAHICHAGWIPISAGILRGYRCTSTPGIKDDLVNAGAEWVDEPVVVDRNQVSSRRPDDLPDFCRAIIKFLAQK